MKEKNIITKLLKDEKNQKIKKPKWSNNCTKSTKCDVGTVKRCLHASGLFGGPCQESIGFI